MLQFSISLHGIEGSHQSQELRMVSLVVWVIYLLGIVFHLKDVKSQWLSASNPSNSVLW